MSKVNKNLIKIAILLIKFYQKTLSFDHGWLKIFKPHGVCRYYPSCSDYMIEALDTKGFFKGLKAGFLRILRCHPWAKGGYDPVREKNLNKEIV